ncbi:MAG: peptidylprolyl isomerase [Bryobacteraceae bacterium]|nr:peptidylprolyl isomerase [Bryobacteraceae bacterium]MCX7603862.1 peptidylprolyl isomerase [Bryobacteraceae bacterium]
MRRLLACVPVLVLAACGGGTAPKQEAKKKAALPAEMPAVWKARFETSKGVFVVEVHRDWAPLGAERFWKLVTTGFFDDSRFYRVRPGFIVQFGMAGDPSLQSLWNSAPLADDPVKQSNTRGTVSFAQAGKGSRRTQVFVNLKDNRALDKESFAPFGRVTEGMEVLESLYAGYGEWSPPGRGPEAARIQTQGNRYLDAQFPRLDRILRARAVVE